MAATVLLIAGGPVWGQIGGVRCTVAASSTPYVVRSSYSALTGDLVVTCTGGTPTPAGSPVPSVTMSVASLTNYTGRLTGTATETLLLIDDPDAAHQVPCTEDPGLCGWTGGHPGPNVFAGILTAHNALAFPNVPLDPPGPNGTRRFRITNIRLDAVNSSVPRPSSPPGALNGIVSISGIPMDPNYAVVAYSATDITGAVADGDGIAVPDVAAGATLPSCTGATNQRVATIRFRQDFHATFRPRSDAAFVDDDTSPAPIAQTVPGAERQSQTGLYNPAFPAAFGLNRAGLADAGTRLQAEINGIPDGVTVFVSTMPVSFTNGVPALNGDGQIRARLTSSAEGPFDPVPVTTMLDGIPAVAVTPVNGKATLVWEVLANPNASLPYADFPVWVSYPTGMQPAALTVKAQAGPWSAVNTASETAPVPRYVDDTATLGLFAIRPTCASGPYFVQMRDSGQTYRVDGITYAARQGFNWTPGSTHTLSAIPANVTGTSSRWIAKPWSDGGAPTHTIVVPQAGMTYTANYQFQYLLSATSVPAAAGVAETVPAWTDGYFDANTDVVVRAVPASGYEFVDFLGGVTGTTNPQTIRMSGASTFTMEFANSAAQTAPVSVTAIQGYYGTSAFRAVFQGVNGPQSLRWVQFLLAAAPDGGGQPFCFLHYDVPGNAFWLYSDVYGFFVGPVQPGASSADLTGTACALSTQLSSIETTDKLLRMNVHTICKTAGDRHLYLRAMDQTEFDTGWVDEGTISQGAFRPTVAPIGAEGADASAPTFKLSVSDPPGFPGIQRGWIQFLLAVDYTGGGQPFCFVHFDRAAHALWMYSSEAGFFLGPVAPGTPSTMFDSSACFVDTAGSSATESSGGVTLRIKVNLKPPMSGIKQRMSRTIDILGRDSGWGGSGSYMVP